MKNTSLIDNTNIDNSIKSVFVPRNETQQIIDIFTNEYSAKYIADMLYGAWVIIESPNNNPEYKAQAAHSVREFIEKAHDGIFGAPSKVGNGLKSEVINLSTKWSKATTDTSGVDVANWSGTIDGPFKKILENLAKFFSVFDASHKPRKQQFKAVLNKLDGTGQPVPVIIEKERLKIWNELDDFFIGVAHHTIETKEKVLRDKIITLETLILDIRYPERGVLEILNTLETYILEGESS